MIHSKIRSKSIPNPLQIAPTCLACLAVILALFAMASLATPAPATETATEAAPDAAPDAAAGPFDWPQYRGPEGDGHHPAASFPTNWPKDGLEVAWSTPLGKGYSGVTAVDGVLYTQYSKDGDEFLAAYDAASGEQKWQLRLDKERPDQFGDGPRSTPTLDGGLIYAVSAFGHLWAVILSHAIAFRVHGTPRIAAIAQVPLAALMVAYTVFGLWLLSTPTGA